MLIVPSLHTGKTERLRTKLLDHNYRGHEDSKWLNSKVKPGGLW